MKDLFTKEQLINIVRHTNLIYETKKGVLFNSLHEGIGGVIFLNYYVGVYLGDLNMVTKSKELFSSLLEEISLGTFRGVSFSNGLAGLCWLVKYYSRLINGESLEISPQIDNYIAEGAIRSINIGNPDPLYGGMGALFYLSHYSARNNKDIIRAFVAKCISDNYGLRCSNIVLKEGLRGEYDIGFAHGLIGYISIIGGIIGQDDGLIETIIQAGLQYVNSQYIPTKYLACYPASVYEKDSTELNNTKEHYNVRLGWCYGDLIIAAMFLQLYKRTEDKSFLISFQKLSYHSLKRNNPLMSHVGDVHFCHGASYLMYIYYVFYLYTHDKDFLIASSYWESYISENLNIEKELKGRPYSFLAGIFGAIVVWLFKEKKVVRSDFFQAYLLNI